MKPLAVGPGPLSRCFQELLDQKIIVRLQQQFLERHWLSPTLMGIDFLHHELGAKKTPAQKKIMSTNAVPQNINHDGWHK